VYTRYDGISWTEPEVIATIPGGSSANPCVIVDAQSNPRVIWVCGVNDTFDIYYTAFDGFSWSAPLNLSNSVEESAYCSMAIDSLDNMYVVWRERLPAPQKSELYYRTHDGSAWSGITNLTQDTLGAYSPKFGYPVKGSKIDLVWSNWYDYPPETYEVVYLALEIVTGTSEGREHMISRLTLTVNPNPFKGNVKIAFNTGNRAQGTEVKIYDAAGILIKSWGHETVHRSNGIIWHGDDERGSQVPAGVYFLYVKGGAFIETKKIIKMQ
jgi:hypothetical protein